MLFYLLIIFLSLLAIHASIHYTRAGRLVNKIPGPTPLPLLGNLLDLNLSAEETWNFIRKIIKYNSITKLWLGTYALICMKNPDDLKIVLTSERNISKARLYKSLKIAAKDGLVTSTGDKWRHRRKILSPAFHKNILKVYSEIVNQNTEKFINEIKCQGDETIQKLKPLVTNLTFSIIWESAMNIDLNNSGTKDLQEYFQAIDELSDITLYRALRPYITDWIAKYMEIGRREKYISEILYKITNKAIQERRKHFEQIGYESFQSITNDLDSMRTRGKQERLVLLDILLSAQNDGIIDEQGVHDEVTTFIIAGFETTALALTAALVLLAENQKEQDKARAEACRVLTESRGKIAAAEIRKMEYIDRCVKESLRLLPGIPSIGRYVSKELQLENFTVPAGHDLAILIFDVHRDPKLWSDPEKFDPDRFLTGNIKKRHPFAYLPFSAGPRSCIGKTFAMMELTAILARILYSFYLEPVDKVEDLKFRMGVGLSTIQDIRVKFIKSN